MVTIEELKILLSFPKETPVNKEEFIPSALIVPKTPEGFILPAKIGAPIFGSTVIGLGFLITKLDGLTKALTCIDSFLIVAWLTLFSLSRVFTNFPNDVVRYPFLRTLSP
jgi:hypothetical protein